MVNWTEGTAIEVLGHFDNLLACANALADQHSALLDYILQEGHAIDAQWKEMTRRIVAREAEHPTEEPATT